MASISEWTFTEWFLIDRNLGWHWTWINQRFFPIHWWAEFLFNDVEAVSLSCNCICSWCIWSLSLNLIFEVLHVFVTFWQLIFLMLLSLLFSKALNFLHEILSLRNSFNRFRTIKIGVAQLFDIFQKIIELILVLELVFIGQQFDKHVIMSLKTCHRISSFAQR